MTKFTVLAGSSHIFGTDDERILRGFLHSPGANIPSLSAEMRMRISELAEKLPNEIPPRITVHEHMGDFQRALRIVVGRTH